MPGKKQAQETPRTARRSTRIASRANSERASSIAPEDSVNVAAGVKTTSAKNGAASKRKTTTKTELSAPIREEEDIVDAFVAIERIVRFGDRVYIHTLTQDQKDEVINAFADHEVARFHQVTEMRREKEEAKQELAVVTAERQTLLEKRDAFRDRMFAQEMAKKSAELQKQKEDEEKVEKAKQAASSTPPTTHTANDAHTSTPTAPAENDGDASMDFDDFSNTSLIQSTPPHRPTLAERAQTEPKPKSFFGSLLRTISSPFTTAMKSAPTPSAPQSPPLQKLGELPASRKRPAPPPEPETEPQQAFQPRQKLAQQKPAPRRRTQAPAVTAPNTPVVSQPRREPASAAAHFHTAEPTLGTITEYTEPTEDSIIVPDPTPPRPPPVLSTRTQPPPTRHREINVMRRNMLNARAATPSRAWDTKPQPREPNADRRMEKLRRYQELDEELRAMKADPETQELIERPLKRVKVDELIAIPHNKPGDASSTFRVPDVDSDDEMEIDEEDSAIRSNVFEDEEEETPKAKEMPRKSIFAPIAQTPSAEEPVKEMAPLQEPEQQQQIVEERPALALAFPAVKQLPPGLENISTEAARLRFEYGFKVWQLDGSLVPGLYSQGGLY